MRARRLIWPALVALLFCALAWAAVPKETARGKGGGDGKEFARTNLRLTGENVRLQEALGQIGNASAWTRFLGENGPDVEAHIDARSGAASSVILSSPIIPGTGKGNRISLGDVSAKLGRPVDGITPEIVAAAVKQFIVRNSAALGIDPSQMGDAQAFQVSEDLWQFSAPQRYKGISVRYARIVGTISHGNLILLGAQTWGNIDIKVRPSVPMTSAEIAVSTHVGAGKPDGIKQWRKTALEILPLSPEGRESPRDSRGGIGGGYEHKLVWSVGTQAADGQKKFEGMVDAQTGDLLSYASIMDEAARRKIKGGVYPLTNTGVCPSPNRCGTMQANTPLSFADYFAGTYFSDAAGVFFMDGNAATSLHGKYVQLHDMCNGGVPINESSASGDIDLGGLNGHHDCSVPNGHTAGDTSASRTATYHLNKIWGIARGWLPANSWLNVRNPPDALWVFANAHTFFQCNAAFSAALDPDDETIYLGDGGQMCSDSCCETCMTDNDLCGTCGQGSCCLECCHECRNPGEIASIPDHEWGHALDSNDKPKDPGNPDPRQNMSNPSEAYGDIAAMYATQESCSGYGWATNYIGNSAEGCGLTADGTGYNVRQNSGDTGPLHCATDCSGVREADYAKHSPSGADTPQNFSCTSCSTSASGGPCGREVHCEAAPANQAAWDLATRKLTAAPFSMDSRTAFNLASRIFYQGSANIGSWYTCNCGGGTADGCNADSGYLQWLVADDDNGTLSDGTPHMTAIYAAFNDHGIACGSPTPVNAGCVGAPNTAPFLVAKPGALKADVCWSPNASVSKYWVMKTDGQAGCDSGRARIATISSGTYNFSDTTVAEGRPYCYSVVPAGTTDKCSGPSSSCVCVTPTTTPPPPNPEITASTDYQTIWGTIFSGNVSYTRVSDNSNEVLKEGLVGGVSKLSHIWKFINVPSSCWVLRYEGNRPNNSEGDNFKFSWAPDVGGSPGTFTDIPGAVINQGFEPQGGLTASFNGTASSTTIYIKIQDTNQTSGSALDQVKIDYLTVIVP